MKQYKIIQYFRQLVVCVFFLLSQSISAQFFYFNKTDSIHFTEHDMTESGIEYFYNMWTPLVCDDVNSYLNRSTFTLEFSVENTSTGYHFGAYPFYIYADFEIVAYDFFGYPISTEIGQFVLNQDQPKQIYTINALNFPPWTMSLGVRFLNLSYDQTATIASLKAFSYFSEEELVEAVSASNPTAAMVFPQQVTQPEVSRTRFEWSSNCSVFPMYQFQLLRLYNQDASLAHDPTQVSATIDWSQALTIEVEATTTHLDLTLAEGSGYYAWRIRPIGNYHSGGITNPLNWGIWSNSPANQNQVNLPADLGTYPVAIYYYQQFDEDKNWIYQRSFTENTQIHDGISYANGLGELQQEQTSIISEDQHIIVNRHLYDYSGRKSMEVLPAPVKQSHLAYRDTLLKNSYNQQYTTADFDGTFTYGNPISVSYGAIHEYYSNSNPDLSIANAEGYPFSQIHYYPDGKIAKTSLPGAMHKINGNHTDRFLYVEPTQDELIRLFGDEAPKSEYVRKVIHVDPNQRMSGSYVDLDGQKLATFLIGLQQDGSALTDLDSTHISDTTVTDRLTIEMLDGEFSSLSSKEIFFSQGSSLTINYSNWRQDIEDACMSYCTSCDYEIIITIQDAENLAIIDTDTLIIHADTCNIGDQITTTFQANLIPQKSYIVSKRVVSNTLNQRGIPYLTQHLKKIDSLVTTNFEMALKPIKDLIDSVDIDGYNNFIRQQNSFQADPVSGDSIAYFQTSCCGTIRLPLRKCSNINFLDSLQDAEGSFINTYNLYHPNNNVSNINQLFSQVNAGELNNMIQDMLAAPYQYDPNKLWSCLRGMAQSFEMQKNELIAANAKYGIPTSKTMFDLLVECMGHTIDDIIFSGSVPIRDAFHVIKYDWANRTLYQFCEDDLLQYCSGVSSFANSTELRNCFLSQHDTIKQAFYDCIGSIQKVTDISLRQSITTQTKDEIRDSAYSSCKAREFEFEILIRDLYDKNGLYLSPYTLNCHVNALINLCTQNVDIAMTAIGDTAKLQQAIAVDHLSRAMVYLYKLSFPPCDTADETVSGGDVTIDTSLYIRRLLQYMNNRLNEFKKFNFHMNAGSPAYPLLDNGMYQFWLDEFDPEFRYNSSCYELPNGMADLYVEGYSNFKLVNCQLIYSYFDGEVIQDLVLCPDVCHPPLSNCTNLCINYKQTIDSEIKDTAYFYTCESVQLGVVQDILTRAKLACSQNRQKQFASNYKNTCIKSLKDSCSFNYDIIDHHHTLFYYDRQGQLVKTVAPKGVNYSSNDRSTHPNHSFITAYSYDGFGVVDEKRSPDGGPVKQYTDRLGLLRFTQTEQQRLDGRYTYIKYDVLKRPVETGETNENIANFPSKVNEAEFPTIGYSGGSDRIYTVYSEKPLFVAHASSYWTQRYTQNRVSYQYTDDGAYDYYSYDPHGNVEWIIKYIPGLSQSIRIEFEYDLISGKVTKVKYNEGLVDQFFHRYTYNSDNEIIKVETSADNIIWDCDARYKYALLGDLKRIVLGQDQVQGIDFTKTLQGWIKGMNHPSLNIANDPGQDGGSSPVAKDVWGMALNFYAGDFNRTYQGTASPFNTGLLPATHDLYDGSPSSWETQIDATQSLQYEQRTGYQFRYDANYQLQFAQFQKHDGMNWSSAAGDYDTEYSYDANGNISYLKRNAYALGGFSQAMDELNYTYLEGKNQLDFVQDPVPNYHAVVDIDNQGTGNYVYDEDGRLLADAAESITQIHWNWQNKITRVEKGNGDVIDYQYDASGNRIAKLYRPFMGNPEKTYYVPDHTGAIAAVYEDDSVNNALWLREQHIYGHEKLGMRKPNININGFNWTVVGYYQRQIGQKTYALKDHLGNTRVTISDRKLKDYIWDIDHFSAEVLSYHHYYPFGMEQVGRNYNAPSYRYGFNGMEKDDELKNNSGTSYDFGARMYDPRLGRWLSRDPLEAKYPSWSAYNFVMNEPIFYVDPDGKAALPSTLFDNAGKLTETTADGVKRHLENSGWKITETLENNKGWTLTHEDGSTARVMKKGGVGVGSRTPRIVLRDADGGYMDRNGNTTGRRPNIENHIDISEKNTSESVQKTKPKRTKAEIRQAKKQKAAASKALSNKGGMVKSLGPTVATIALDYLIAAGYRRNFYRRLRYTKKTLTASKVKMEAKLGYKFLGWDQSTGIAKWQVSNTFTDRLSYLVYHIRNLGLDTHPRLIGIGTFPGYYNSKGKRYRFTPLTIGPRGNFQPLKTY